MHIRLTGRWPIHLIATATPTASRSTRPKNYKFARKNWGVRVWDLNLLMLGDLVLELARLLRNQYPRQADPWNLNQELDGGKRGKQTKIQERR